MLSASAVSAVGIRCHEDFRGLEAGTLLFQPTGNGKCRILREILDLSLGSMVNSRTGLPRLPRQYLSQISNALIPKL